MHRAYKCPHCGTVTRSDHCSCGGVARLKEQADRLSDAIRTRFDQYTGVTDQLRPLYAAGICTGKVHWRDANHPDRKAKMVIVHGVDQACPIHGDPDPGQRLRAYVGTHPARQHESVAAIERHQEYSEYERQAKAMRQAFARLEQQLCELFDCLGYTLPSEGAPQPRNDWPRLYQRER